MHHLTELPFIDEFRWVSPHHYLKNGWQNAVLRWCMLQAGPPSLHYYCAVMLHSCILLPPVSHSSNHEYHCCQLTRQSSCVLNFYCTFKVLVWLSLVCRLLGGYQGFGGTCCFYLLGWSEWGEGVRLPTQVAGKVASESNERGEEVDNVFVPISHLWP